MRIPIPPPPPPPEPQEETTVAQGGNVTSETQSQYRGEMNKRALGEPPPPPPGLEASLLHLIHHHNLSSSSLRLHTEKAKKEARRAGMRVSELVVDAVNGGVEESFLNQKRIELEIRSLSASISRFQRQTDQWLAASSSLNSALKEIGDFENWMKVMEYDCKSITAAIRNIHQA